MQLTLEDIELYSKCPKQYSFYKATKTNPIIHYKDEERIVKEIIKQSYINRTQHNYDPEWSTIKSRINKYCFEGVDVSQKDIFEPVYRKSIQIMTALHYWYYNMFVNDSRFGIVNVPLSINVANSTINMVADIVLIDQEHGPVPIIFGDTTTKSTTVNRDIKFKTMLLALAKQTQTAVRAAEMVLITPETVKYKKLLNKTPIDTIEKYVTFIVKGIEHSIFYPSVNEQCNNCSFRNVCVL